MQADPRNEGDEKDLRRHLICLDRETGKVIWDKTVEPVLPEDDFSGTFTQHGYASHTPVSDGKNIYVFFGKTGALAFDLDGNKLWQTSVGTGSGARRWGTASSPILYKDLLIVPAAAESESLVGLNKKTGKKVWSFTDPSLSGTWGTPVLADCGEGRTDLVLAVPDKIWGLDPQTGKPRWHCDGPAQRLDDQQRAGPGRRRVLAGDRSGGRRHDGREGRRRGRRDQLRRPLARQGRSRIGTPIIDGNRIYCAGNKMADLHRCRHGQVDLSRRYHRAARRLPIRAAAARRSPAGLAAPAVAVVPGARGRSRRWAAARWWPAAGRGGRGGRGGGMGGQDYSSPVLADGKIYFVSRLWRDLRLRRRPGLQALVAKPVHRRRRLHRYAGHQRRANLHPLQQVLVLHRTGGGKAMMSRPRRCS